MPLLTVLFLVLFFFHLSSHHHCSVMIQDLLANAEFIRLADAIVEVSVCVVRVLERVLFHV